MSNVWESTWIVVFAILGLIALRPYKRAGDKFTDDATAPCSPPAIGITFSYGLGGRSRSLPMLILEYFVTTGMLLSAALLILNAYFDQSGPSPARLPRSSTVTSLLLVLPATQTKGIVTPDVPQPKVAAASAPKSKSNHHRHRVR
jgi:hypothetical protein